MSFKKCTVKAALTNIFIENAFNTFIALIRHRALQTVYFVMFDKQ